MNNSALTEQENFKFVDIKQVSGTSPPPFDDRILVNFDDFCQYRIFTTASIKSYYKVDTVDLAQIYGTEQAHYSGDTLGHILRDRLKRIGGIVDEAETNPFYYYCDEIKENIDYIEVGDLLFVGAGKHRSLGLLYLAHYHPSIYVLGPMLSGVKVKKLVEVADFTAVMEEYKGLLSDHPQLLVDFPKTYCGLNNSMPTLRNWQKNISHQFTSVREFRNCMEDLRKTNALKKMLGFKFHSFF